MKIALVNHGIFPDVLGGMERHTYNLAYFLTQEGLDVEVLVPEPSKGTSYPFPVHHLPWPKKPFWLWSNYAFSQNVEKWVETHRPDIVFGQGFNLWAYLPHKTLPCIFHPHGLEMFGSYMTTKEKAVTFPFRKLVKYSGKYADFTISLGGQLTNILEEKANIKKSKIRVIPNAVDLKQFPFSEEKRIPNSFLFVGRLAFNKGIDILISAFSQIESKDFELTIVGNGPFRRKIENLAASNSHVKYFPKPSDDELRKFYQTHECLVFTSRFEGMPTVILEAMASGCSVIATKIGAVEAVVTQETGFLVEPNPKDLSKSLVQFLQLSNPQRKALGLNGFHRIRDFFSWPSVLPAYRSLFEELLN